ncbi:MAG: type secretion system protein ImpJ [Verrucomicrobiota bacterium]|jgi:type VI secretion system protein ImpJ|nr:type secretion system protein ImpJ [Verrucomicrobiota bacterium]
MQVHWHEGLFLLPHHLQRIQRSIFEVSAFERRLSRAYPYGLIDARLSNDDLENMRLRFDRLHAIMPSGQEVLFPADAELPAMDIKQAFESRGRFTVYLGVPLWFAARANSVNPGQTVDPRAKILYRISETEVADENTGENTKTILHRRVNARLLLENDDRSDLEVIPLLRVTRAAGEEVGLPRRDPEFVGPCLILNGSATLRELVRDLSSQVLGSRQELVVQITRGGFSIDTMRGIQFEQMMRLRTLNRFGARLEALVESPNLAPFDIYLELRELLGELAALHPDRDLYDSAPYQHDNPYPCFSELTSKIRELLKGSVAPSFLKVPFIKINGVLKAALTDEHFLRPSDYFLGIRTKEDPRSLAQLVEDADRFKLMPESMAGRAIRGVILKEERFPPLELPAQSNLYYFRLLRGESARSWQQIQTEKSAVVRWTGNESADYDLVLYMTLPKSET